MTAPLAPRHTDELFRDSGIHPKVASRRGYRSIVTPEDVRELSDLGFADYQLRPGLLIPLYSTAVSGLRIGWLLKPDDPRIVNGRVVKYEQPHESIPHLDVHPGAQPVLREPTTPIWFTEGPKKSDALYSRGIPCVTLVGTFMFLHGRLVIPDLDEIDLKGRVAYVVFDSDVTRKPSVAEALLRFCAALDRRGATVMVVYLPEGPDGAKNGVDDALVAGLTVEDLKALARPWDGRGPGIWLQTASDDDVAELRRQLSQARAENTALATLIHNPDLTLVEIRAAHALATEAKAKRDRGEVDETGCVTVSASEISNDWRRKPAPGERLAPANPRPNGTRPRMARSNVKPVLTKAIERGLIPATPIRVPRRHSSGTGYLDTEWKVMLSPATSLADLLNPWATYHPEEPKLRKPRTIANPCPHCGEIHPVRRQNICLGCGTVIAERVIAPEPPEGYVETGDNLSPVNTAPPPPTPSLIGRSNISGPPEEPDWLQFAPDPTPDDVFLAAEPPAPNRHAVHAEIVTASHPPTPEAGRQALHDLGADLSEIARSRGRTPVPKPIATPLPGMSAPTSLDPWTDVAMGGRHP